MDALLEVEKLRRPEIEFEIVNLSVDTATPVGELIYTVMVAVSQFERQTLIRRTKEGMVAARSRGKHIGRPPNPFLEEVALADSRVEAGEGIVAEIAEQFGCSRKNLAEESNHFEFNSTPAIDPFV